MAHLTSECKMQYYETKSLKHEDSSIWLLSLCNRMRKSRIEENVADSAASRAHSKRTVYTMSNVAIMKTRFQEDQSIFLT